jgi:two-component system sensor histidine kinase HydH
MQGIKSHYFYFSIRFLLAGIFLSLVVSWFAVNQYRKAIPLAEENLSGLALSLSAAIEAISGRDPSFSTLEDFHTPDIAYMAIVDRNGTILFHSNKALVGSRVPDRRFAALFEKGGFSGSRVRLGTGEEIYESNSVLHVAGKTLVLRIALHTYRADAVIRRARVVMMVLFSLVATAWVLGLLLNGFAVREETHKREMARRQQMARLGEMGAVVAHEIRNPLAGIKGYAQLLHARLGTSEEGQSAGLIVGEAIRLEEMVNELLDYTRPDKGAPEQVKIHEAITRSLSIISREAIASDVTIESSVDQSLKITANRNRIEQLFLNLFRNALQAMPDGGKLTVSGRHIRSGVEILVADTGRGIDTVNLERVFEPFFTTKARGTGLGLAICRKIAEEYNGEIMVERNSREGTTFRLAFPDEKA